MQKKMVFLQSPYPVTAALLGDLEPKIICLRCCAFFNISFLAYFKLSGNLRISHLRIDRKGFLLVPSGRASTCGACSELLPCSLSLSFIKSTQAKKFLDPAPRLKRKSKYQKHLSLKRHEVEVTFWLKWLVHWKLDTIAQFDRHWN